MPGKRGRLAPENSTPKRRRDGWRAIAADRDAHEERRYDTDGGLYTKAEFIEEYGGTREWHKARKETAVSEPRSTAGVCVAPPGATTSMQLGKLSGTATQWHEGQGFGFIKPDDGSEDIFVHFSRIEGTDALPTGTRVTYVKVFNHRKGKDMAVEVCIVSGAAQHRKSAAEETRLWRVEEAHAGQEQQQAAMAARAARFGQDQRPRDEASSGGGSRGDGGGGGSRGSGGGGGGGGGGISIAPPDSKRGPAADAASSVPPAPPAPLSKSPETPKTPQLGKLSGTATQWHEAQGFGFIEPDDGSENLFVHRTSIEGADALPNGTRVTYVKGFDHRKGKDMAGKVCIINGPPKKSAMEVARLWREEQAHAGKEQEEETTAARAASFGGDANLSVKEQERALAARAERFDLRGASKRPRDEAFSSGGSRGNVCSSGADGAAPSHSKRQGKQALQPEPARRHPCLRSAADGRVSMELVLRGEISISDHKRALIVRKSGCRLQSSVQPSRAAMLALNGTALQLRHAAQLLLKDAKASVKGRSGMLELQVAVDDIQAGWVLGKSGGTLQQLRHDAGIAADIRRPHGDSDRLISLRGDVSTIPEAVHSIAELWLGQGTAPRRVQSSGGGGASGGSSSSAAGSSASASSSGSAGAPTAREVRVRPCEEIPAEKRRKLAEEASAPRSGPSPPVAADTSPGKLSPERPEAEAEAEAEGEAEAEAEAEAKARAEQDSRVAEVEARMAAEAAAHRLEMQRLEEQLRRAQRQLQEQAPLSEEEREEHVANLREVIQAKRPAGAKPWKWVKMRREILAPAFTKADEGKSLSISGGAVKVSGGSTERAVLWAGPPDDVKSAEILSVEERIGGRLEVQGAEMLRENPKTGLVAQVLWHMGKVAERGKSWLWKPTEVSFDGEDGQDDGGLRVEMHAAFWQGVISVELGLFEKSADQLEPAFLPKPGASEHDLEMVGLMLSKSLLDEHPTGPGLGRFVFDFLLEKNGRLKAFAAESKPIIEQAEVAICSLSQFDVQYASLYRNYLHDESGEPRTSEWVDTFLGADSILGERLVLNDNHELFNEPVTVDSLPRGIVASCKWILRESRLAELEALRRGFTSHVDVTTQLRLLPLTDVMLVVQGRYTLSAEQLVGEIEWPDTAEARSCDDGMSVAEAAGFTPDSTTCELLRSILLDEQLFPLQKLQGFLQWVTGRRVLPEGGLAGTGKGKITLKCRYPGEGLRWTDGDDEFRWPSPVSSTCNVEVTLPNYSSRAVLAHKLLNAIEETKDRNFLR